VIENFTSDRRMAAEKIVEKEKLMAEAIRLRLETAVLPVFGHRAYMLLF